MVHRLSGLIGLVLILSGGHVYSQGNSLAFPDTTGRTGEELVIPLRGSFQDSVSGVELTVVFDPNVVRISAVSLATATASFSVQTHLSSGSLRMALAGANPIAGEITVVELTLRLIGPPGTTSALDIIPAILDEGELAVSTTDGLIAIVREAKIIGAVFYYDGLQPVPETTVGVKDLAGSPILSDLTDASGEYVLGPLSLGDYQLVISKEEEAYAAINVLDVSDILRHLVGYIEFSQDQQRAGDVSGNGRVGTTDASLILRYLVGLETPFPAGPFWQFRPAERMLNLLEDTFQNFTAFLIGDVNGDWEATASVFKIVATIPSLKFTELPLAPPGKASFALSGENLAAVRGGVLKLVYDPRVMEIEEIEPARWLENFLVAINLDHAGEIQVAFAGANPIQGAGELFHLRFRERGAQGTITAIEIQSASLNSTSLSPPSLARRTHTLGGSSDDPSTAVEQNRTDLPATPQLGQNFPNPFNRATAIQYQLTAPGQIGLEIFDLAGQKVRTLVDTYQESGLYRTSWNGIDDHGGEVSTGTYLVRLRINAFAASKKILLIK